MQLTPLIAADPGRFCRRCSQCRLPPFRRSLLRHAFDEPLCGRGENRKVRLRTCRRRNLGTIVFVGVFSVNRRQLSPAAPDRLHEARALLAQNALHAPDRVALTVEQVANAAQEIDVFGTIEASSSAPLHRSDLRESAFPETQHMLRHIDLVGNFANGAECPRRLVHWPVPAKISAHSRHYGVACPSASELIRCLRIADGLNTITRRGEIGTSLPVFGLRPIRWPFLRTTNEPNDDSFTVSPRSRQSVISLSTSSTRVADSVRDRPTF